MKTAVIIQARLGSTRLPAKVLLPLPTGRTVLEEVIFRCRQIEGVDVVVVALADDAGSNLLLPCVDRAKSLARPISTEYVSGGVEYTACAAVPSIEIVRGPEHDVLKRYVIAAEAVDADVIMRVTADCPLIDPDVCAAVLAHFNAGEHVDYCSNVHPRSFPHGLDCEVFTRAALLRADAAATSAACREHVTLYMYTSQDFRRCNYGQGIDQSKTRWTLDTIEDYVTICNEFDRRSRLDRAA